MNYDEEIWGEYFEPQSALARSVRLRIGPDEIWVLPEGEPKPVNMAARSDIRLDPPLGNLRGKITFPDGAIFRPEDGYDLGSLHKPGFWQRLAHTERFGWHLLPIAIVTPVLAFGLYRLMIPVLITVGLFFTPDSVLNVIDRNTMRTLDFTMMEATEVSERRQREITEIFDELVSVTDAKGALINQSERYDYKLLFRQSDVFGANALALPGGTVIVTDDLVEQFEQDYVLAAILAHEIGHVEEQHSLRQIYRALGMAAMVTLIAGDAGPMLEDIVLEGSAILSLSFSRQHETDADNYSLKLLRQTDFRKDGLITFFEALDEEFETPKEGEWLMTHPANQTRVDNIRQQITTPSN